MKDKMKKYDMAQLIDHTLLKPFATAEDFKKLCEEAMLYSFKMVAVNSCPVKMCKEFLRGSEVHVGAAIGFPLGQTTIRNKAAETLDAIEDGADEIDYVINIGKLKERNYEYIKEEMEQIVKICRKNEVICKVIFENCYLTREEKIKMCEIAGLVKPDFIKTSTGFGLGGADVEDVRLMKRITEGRIKVKAAGGIRDYRTFLKMIDAGAERIGTSSGIEIISGFEKLK